MPVRILCAGLLLPTFSEVQVQTLCGSGSRFFKQGRLQYELRNGATSGPRSLKGTTSTSHHSTTRRREVYSSHPAILASIHQARKLSQQTTELADAVTELFSHVRTLRSTCSTLDQLLVDFNHLSLPFC